MPVNPMALTVKSLRFLLGQLGPEHDDKEVAVLMSHYGRLFPVMAIDELDPEADYAKDKPDSIVLVAHRRPVQ